ncbi:MAG: hypothetical protein ACRCT8_04105, partial [Lacipirellulaceae bacterium]
FSDPGACVPSREASWVAAYRQVWIDILSMVSGGSTEALLREVVRGELKLKTEYEKLLLSDLHFASTTLLVNQLRSVQASHRLFAEAATPAVSY